MRSGARRATPAPALRRGFSRASRDRGLGGDRRAGGRGGSRAPAARRRRARAPDAQPPCHQPVLRRVASSGRASLGARPARSNASRGSSSAARISSSVAPLSRTESAISSANVSLALAAEARDAVARARCFAGLDRSLRLPEGGIGKADGHFLGHTKTMPPLELRGRAASRAGSAAAVGDGAALGDRPSYAIHLLERVSLQAASWRSFGK